MLKIRMVYFVIINSFLFILLCIWILFYIRTIAVVLVSDFLTVLIVFTILIG